MVNFKLDRNGLIIGIGIGAFCVGVLAFLKLNKKVLLEDEKKELDESRPRDSEKNCMPEAKKIIFNENYSTIDKSERVPYHMIGLNGDYVAMPGKPNNAVEETDEELDQDPAEYEHPSDDEVEPEIYDEETADEESYYNPVSDFNDDPNAIEYEDGPEEEKEIQVFENDNEKSIKNEYPYEISFEEYDYAQRDGFGPEQIALTYYSEDGILVDEDNEIIRNPGSIIGGSTLTMIKRNKAKITYIRNEKLGIDYEIYLERGHYEGNN